jgi:hypothetical protein
MDELVEALEGTDLGDVDDFTEVDEDASAPICPDWTEDALLQLEADGIDPFESAEPWGH